MIWNVLHLLTVSWLAVSLPGAVRATEPVCREVKSPCSCKTDQGVVDLRPLDKTGTAAPRFSRIDDPGRGDTYYYNPCTPFSFVGGQSCNNMAVCQGFPKADPTNYWEFGSHSNAVFTNDPQSGKLQITYQHPTLNRKSTVTLECNANEEGTLTFDQADGMSFVKFTLTSKYACAGGGGGGGGGLSIGTILCIVFIVVVAVYIIGGVLFMHFARGARGVESIPNIALWKEIPGLVRDGTLFVTRPVRAATTGYQTV